MRGLPAATVRRPPVELTGIGAIADSQHNLIKFDLPEACRRCQQQSSAENPENPISTRPDVTILK
jgi:hypothetical protein